MDIVSWLLASIIVLGAASMQVLTGFGFALVAVPLLLFIFTGYQAILISMILSFCLLLSQAIMERKQAKWLLILRLVFIGFPGLIAGVYIGGVIEPIYVKGIVGLTIVSYVVIQLLRQKHKVDEGKKEERLPKGFYLAGLTSGALTGAVGIPGPPVVAVLVGHLSRGAFRATSVNYFVIQYTLALIFAAVLYTNEFTLSTIRTVLILLIPTFFGYALGYPLRKYINETNFKRLVYGLLILMGAISMFELIKYLLIT